MSRVAVVGNLARDVVDGANPTPGGCPRFAADAFRRLGRGGQIVTRFREEDGALFGPVLGAVVLLGLEDVLSALTEHWQIILGPFLVVVVLFAKRGLFGLVSRDG